MPLRSRAPRPLRRALSLLVTLALLPLTLVLAATPAHAATLVVGTVEDALGEPIVAATVDVFASDDTGGTPVATESTDVDGAYELDLPEGSYRIRFSATDFTTGWYGDEGPTGPVVAVDDAGVVTVDDEVAEDGDLGATELAGTETYPVSGLVVVSGSEDPLEGIEVSAFTDEEMTDPAVDATTSDDSGAYTLSLPVGLYLIRAEDTDGTPPTMATTWLGFPPVEVSVHQGGGVDVDGSPVVDTLPSIEMEVADANATYDVVGVVEDLNGDPIEGVTATGVPVNGTDAGQEDDATTNADGEFTLALKPGDYRVDVDGGSDFADASYDDTVTVALNGTVTPSSDLGSIALTSTATYSVSGTVTDGTDGLQDILVEAFPDADLDADPGDVISVRTDADGDYSFEAGTASGLPIDTYVLQFTDDNGGAYDQTWYGSTTAPGSEVTVAQGGAVRVGDATHSSDLGTTTMALGAGPYAVVGDVSDAVGDPIAGATVTATKQGGGTATDTTDAAGAYALDLAVGTWTISVAKTDFATTSLTAATSSPAQVVVNAGGTVTVDGTTAPGRNVGSIEMPGTATYALSGTVQHNSTNLAGILVEAFPDADLEDESPVSVRTNASGAYSFTGATGLVVGTYVLQFTDDDGTVPQYDQTWYGSADSPGLEVTVAQGGVIRVDDATHSSDLGTTTMALGAGPYAVVGDVSDANGDPIAGATVTATKQGGGTATDTTDAEGGFEISLEIGTWTISVAKTGFTTTALTAATSSPAQVVVNAGGTVTVDSSPAPGRNVGSIEMPGSVAYALSGTVKHDSTNLAGILVEAFPDADLDADPDDVISVRTNASGAYSFSGASGLVVGTYVLQFTDDDSTAPQYDQTWYGSATSPGLEVTVAQGGVIRVDDATHSSDLGTTTMALGTGPYAVVGDVSDANGDPIAGATVTAFKSGGGTTVGSTDSEGVFSLSLAVGTYTSVVVSKVNFTTTTLKNDDDATAVVVVSAGGTVKVDGVTAPGRNIGSVEMAGSVKYALSGAAKQGSTNLAGILVQAFPDADLEDEGPVAVRTNASGAYSFTGSATGLVVGTYVLQFTDDDSAAPQYDQTWYGSATSPGLEVTVAQDGVIRVDDVAISGHDLGTTQMAIGTGPYAVTGDVSDVNGDPIVGAAVAATRQGGGTATDTTDADGLYSLSLAVGTWTIRVTKSGFSPAVLTTDDETSALVVVSNGGTVTVDGEPAPGRYVGYVEMKGTTRFAVTGQVQNAAAAGLAGITVTAEDAYDTESATTSTTSGSGGAFSLSGAKGLVVGTYLLRFNDNTSNAVRYQQTYFGGATAAEVTVTQTGAVLDEDGDPVTILVTMQQVTASTTYPLKGAVYDPDFEELDGVTVTAVPVSGTPAGNKSSAVSGFDADLDQGGVYSVRVKPGKYQLLFAKSGYETSYLLSWEDDSPVTITVGSTGEITAPGLDLEGGLIDDMEMLYPQAAFTTNPKLQGKVKVGQVVTVTNGTLKGVSVRNGDVTVDWFLDGKLVAEWQRKYKIPASAATKTLSFRVTIEDPDGLRASSVFTSSGVKVPKAKATVKAALKKGKLKVTVKVPGLPKPTGKITVKDGKKKVGKAKLKTKSKGKATIALKKLKPGKHKLTVVYGGAKTIAPAKKVIKVTIKK